jgi:hypothetical protein
MHGNEQEFIASIAGLLGWFYVLAAAGNLGAAIRWHRTGRSKAAALIWVAVAALFATAAALCFAGRPPAMPESFKSAIDAVLGPGTLTVGSFAFLAAFYLGRRFFVRPAVAWAGLNASLVFLGTSLTDPDFAQVVARPDNVPIVGLVYLLGFFLWLATSRAVTNDQRARRGLGPVEKEQSRTVLVWPDLVYIELITMLLATTVLLLWSIGLKAPLEQPANPAVTPNPSKAPWYFVGLQEMLVFFDASIAGVVLPSLIILGLAAIPYLDFNRKGSGYYTIAERKFGYLVFLFGFLQLWILLILIGTFMRGPNWNFYGLYETRDPDKLAPLTNVRLSDYFWGVWLGQSVPQVPAGAGTLARLAAVAWREIAGLSALGTYFLLLPPLLARTFFRNYRRQMGWARYTLMSFLLLMMMTLPLKMILRWTIHLSYVVSMPEYYFNF